MREPTGPHPRDAGVADHPLSDAIERLALGAKNARTTSDRKVKLRKLIAIVQDNWEGVAADALHALIDRGMPGGEDRDDAVLECVHKVCAINSPPEKGEPKRPPNLRYGQKVDKWDPQIGPFAKYLRGIIRKIAWDRAGKRWRLAEHEQSPTGPDEDLPDERSTLGESLTSLVSDSLDLIESPKVREVIRLRYVEGQAVEDIPARAEIGINTVKTHIRTGRVELKLTSRKSMILQADNVDRQRCLKLLREKRRETGTLWEAYASSREQTLSSAASQCNLRKADALHLLSLGVGTIDECLGRPDVALRGAAPRREETQREEE